MLETLIITLREGVEAFLIVAVVMSYLAKTGRTQLFTPVYWAIGVSILTSLGVAYAVQHYVNSELAEGLMAMIAGVLVFSMTIHMLKAGKHLSKQIKDKLEMNAQKVGKAAGIGIFLFVVVMITREGMEIAILMNSLALQTDSYSMIIGAILGVAGAVAVSFAWIKYSHLINLGKFMQVTAIFLALFSVHLFMYGVHELTESFKLPFSYETNLMLHESTEAFDHDQPLGMIIGYSVIVLPLLWLAFSTLRDKINRLPTGN